MTQPSLRFRPLRPAVAAAQPGPGDRPLRPARFLAGELTGRDRLAIVTFDDSVEVVVPSTPVTDPQPFIAAINTIHSGGCTALFDGWRAGATQVAEHLDPAAMNRVLLLSDGQANAGLTQRGISTSASGLGDDAGVDAIPQTGVFRGRG